MESSSTANSSGRTRKNGSSAKMYLNVLPMPLTNMVFENMVA